LANLQSETATLNTNRSNPDRISVLDESISLDKNGRPGWSAHFYLTGLNICPRQSMWTGISAANIIMFFIKQEKRYGA
jgi:hypothetical protein